MPRFGAQSMSGRLERVLVRPPLAEDAERWREYGWHAAPDLVAYRDGDQLAFALLGPSTGDHQLLELRIPFVPTDATPPQWAANDLALVRGPPGNALVLTLEPT